jgi:WD40 repeat protein
MFESRLSELLGIWEQAQDRGVELCPEKLCPHDDALLAELRRRIAWLRWVAGDPESPLQSTQKVAPAAAHDGRAFPEIPGYEILSELGRGGMGVVYKAWQVRLGRIVALKMIGSGTSAGPEELARFRLEADAVARMQHPNVVQIYDVGEHDGRPYFPLEFVEGGSLAQKLAGKPLPCREAAALVQTLARAIDCAHQRGIVHRDLKPANVLLTADGTPKITDFGLAKLQGEAGLSQAGQPLGTASYMPPEQALGNLREIGPAADVYALGAILYECLTGGPPFLGETWQETVMQVLTEEPLAPNRRRRDVPRDLETICLKCLHKQPAGRYDSAQVLADRLGLFLAGKPIPDRPVAWWERGYKWARRHPALAGLILLGGLTLLALVAFAVGLYYNASLQHALHSARQERERADAARLLGRRHLYATQVNLAQRSWREANVRHAVEVLESLRPGPGEEDLRGFEWHYLWGLCHRTGLTLKGHTREVSGLAFSPDGRLLATVGWDRRLQVWDAKTGEPHHGVVGHADLVYGVTFSPDGSRLATASWDGSVKVWDAQRNAELLKFDTEGLCAYATAFSPDGRLLAAALGDRPQIGRKGRVVVWDLSKPAGRPVWALGLDRPALAVAFHPDGQRVVAAGQDCAVRICDVRGDKGVVIGHHADWVSGLAFSQDGQRLASCSHDGTVKVWDVEAGRERFTTRSHRNRVLSVAFSPDGRMLASGGRDRVVRLWDAAAGAEVRTFHGHQANVRCVAFSPDGRRVASGGDDQTVKLWDVRADQESVPLPHDCPVIAAIFNPADPDRLSSADEKTLSCWTLSSRQRRVCLPLGSKRLYCLALDPRGTCLALADERNTVSVLNTATLEVTALPDKHPRPVNALAYSHDGRRLAAGSASRWLPLEHGQLTVYSTSGYQTEWSRDQTCGVYGLAFAPDGGRLAAARGDGQVHVWDVKAKGLYRRLSGHGHAVRGVAYSPDGKLLASASWDRTVKLWDVEAGTCLLTLSGHINEVLSVDFSPDGKRLASASADRTVKVWDTVTGEELLTLRGHSNEVYSVRFRSDGQWLASASEDATVRLWDATAARDGAAPKRSERP